MTKLAPPNVVLTYFASEFGPRISALGLGLYRVEPYDHAKTRLANHVDAARTLLDAVGMTLKLADDGEPVTIDVPRGSLASFAFLGEPKVTP